MFLVDTNIVSELPRPRPAMEVVRWLQRQPIIMLSVISVEELAFGVARAPVNRRAKLARWLDDLVEAARIVEVTEPIARAAGELRAAREIAGRRVAQADMLIAATALVHGFSLVTRNVRDFVECGVALIDPFED
ncbi:MAG: type II toxin-antitoxin system VapC family toxin [Deltaproteobacteria bacterium]|nr:type II toxin-antitoxin system VapC family toxin [Nannocystaceae bacterium]